MSDESPPRDSTPHIASYISPRENVRLVKIQALFGSVPAKTMQLSTLVQYETKIFPITVPHDRLHGRG